MNGFYPCHLCPRGLSDHLSPKIFPKCPLEWKFNPFKPASKKVEIDGLDQNRHLAHRPGQPKTIKESILTTYSFIYNNWFLSIILRYSWFIPIFNSIIIERFSSKNFRMVQKRQPTEYPFISNFNILPKGKPKFVSVLVNFSFKSNKICYNWRDFDQTSNIDF